MLNSYEEPSSCEWSAASDEQEVGHLKEKQKNWIMETARQEYDRFVRERGKLPVHGSNQQLIEHIYEVIEAKGVWIPYGEVKRVLGARIAHWNRQAGGTTASNESEIPSPPIWEKQT